MKRKKLVPLFAMLTAGCILFLSGCSVDVTNINEEEVPLSVEMEAQNLSEGSISMHSIWYDTAGNKLSSAEIAFYDNNEEVFSGTTDENGYLETCILPCNTVLYCTISDSAGTVNAECDILIKLSEDYTNLTIYPTEPTEEEEEIAECVIEIPIDKTDIRASAFITESGAISFSSLTPYVEEEAAAEEAEAEEAEAEEVVAEEAEAEEAEDTAEEVIEEETAEEAEDTAEENSENEESGNEEE